MLFAYLHPDAAPGSPAAVLISACQSEVGDIKLLLWRGNSQDEATFPCAVSVYTAMETTWRPPPNTAQWASVNRAVTHGALQAESITAGKPDFYSTSETNLTAASVLHDSFKVMSHQ